MTFLAAAIAFSIKDFFSAIFASYKTIFRRGVYTFYD
jgi:hypothetical protein